MVDHLLWRGGRGGNSRGNSTYHWIWFLTIEPLAANAWTCVSCSSHSIVLSLRSCILLDQVHIGDVGTDTESVTHMVSSSLAVVAKSWWREQRDCFLLWITQKRVVVAIKTSRARNVTEIIVPITIRPLNSKPIKKHAWKVDYNNEWATASCQLTGTCIT